MKTLNAWTLIITSTTHSGTTTLTEVSFGLDEKVLNKKFTELAEYEAFQACHHVASELERKRRAPLLYKKWYNIFKRQLDRALLGESIDETHIEAAVISEALYLLIISSDELKAWVDKDNDLFSRMPNRSIAMCDFISAVGWRFSHKLASQMESLSVPQMSWTMTRAPQ